MRPAMLSLDQESRSGQVIGLIARRGEITVAEMVRELGVTTTAVRQQVNRLLDRGWVVRRRRRGGPGRPADVFALSDAGRGLFAHNVDVLARLLMQEICAADGPDHLEALLQRVHARMNRGVEEQLHDTPTDRRVAELARLLGAQGTVVHASECDGAQKLSVYTCPFHGVVEEAGQLCELERAALHELTGEEVELKQRLVDGHHCCEFHFASAGNGDRPERRNSTRNRTKE